MKRPRLITESPDTSPEATFSRFVLPFKYHLVEEPLGDCATPFYKRMELTPPVDDRKFERLHYLTIETADVLFKRAWWFELSPACADPVTFLAPLATGTFRVAMRPPRIVLFEFPELVTSGQTAGRDAQTKGHDLLATGFLLVDLYFPRQDDRRTPTIDDLLRLNELFRYCRIPFHGHTEKYKATVDAFPPQYCSPTLSSRSPGDTAGGDQSTNDPYHERWANLLDYPLKPDDNKFKFMRLFPPEWRTNAAQSQKQPLGASEEDSRGWVIHADNRAFVWTCAVIRDGAFALRSVFGGKVEVSRYGHWVKLLNVDRPSEPACKTQQTSVFEQKWAEERTYRRWEHTGTVYGFTTHSGALLVRPGHYATNFADMYFDQTLLLLYLRAVTFRFSESLSRLSSDMRGHGHSLPEAARERFDELRRELALFTNLYQFPLVSNQQQGLELYSLARKCLDIDELFREVQQEIESTHSYIELRDTQRLTRATTVFSVVSGFGLAFGLAMAFLGMNVIIPDFKRTGEWCRDWSCVGSWALENLGWFAGVMGVSLVLVWFGIQFTRSSLGYPRLEWRRPGAPRESASDSGKKKG